MVSTERKRLDLHRLFAEPWSNTLRVQAFTRMSDLVIESMEEVRMLSATLQDTREALRVQVARLRERSMELGDRSAPAREPRCQDEPSAEERQEAERLTLDKFKVNLASTLHSRRSLKAS